MPHRRFRSVADIIAFAVEREKEAADGYGRMAGLARTPGLREFLLFLRQEEEAHRRLLEGLTEEELDGLVPAFVPDLRLIDYLVEEKLTDDMSLQELLIFAAQKEKKAAELYDTLARMAEASGHHRVFEFLAGQERAHKLKIEAEYEKNVLQEN
ncbi:MAG: ferritin family protein [Acidobacteria bacterium]|nr:ferritin family protein [Acidobacteriota bacterium]